MHLLRAVLQYPLVFRPWRPYPEFTASSVRSPDPIYQEALARWCRFCRASGPVLSAEDSIHPSIDAFLRHFAIETGELEDLYRLYPQSKVRALTQGLHVLTDADQKPVRGVPLLTAAHLLALVDDQYVSIAKAREVGLLSHALTEGGVRFWQCLAVRSQPRLSVSGLPLLNVPRVQGGRYKTSRNLSVLAGGRPFRTCPPSVVTRQIMHLLVQIESLILSSVETTACAAWVHTAFGHLHPFVDGNTRTARLLTAYVFCRRGECPPVFLSADIDSYLEVRRDAEAGDLEPLRSMIERRALAVLELV